MNNPSSETTAEKGGAAAQPDAISSSHSQAKQTAWFRAPLVMPLAAVLTVGLTFSMAQLIATEFQPQDKSEAVKFEINPVEKIIDIKLRIDEPDILEKVETPPPPPTTGMDVAEPVKEPAIKIVSVNPDFELPEIDFGGTGYVKPDTNEKPIVRIPPVMPARFQQGDASGYCKMRFSVSPNGQPFDVTASQCTHKILERASQKAVLNWKYNPKIVNGRAVSRSGVETKIRFDLADERGNRLPVPDGY